MKLFQKVVSKLGGLVALIGFFGCIMINAESENWYIYLTIFGGMFIAGMFVMMLFDDVKYYVHKLEAGLVVLLAFMHKHFKLNSKSFKQAYKTKQKYRTYSNLYYNCFKYLEMND